MAIREWRRGLAELHGLESAETGIIPSEGLDEIVEGGLVETVAEVGNKSSIEEAYQQASAETEPAIKEEEIVPSIHTRLRHHIVEMPAEIQKASGINIFGRRIKSIVFSTDLAIIKNCDADAVFAVYPFTPQQSISDALIKASAIPVFTGVGGGTTKGPRIIGLARDAESQGAYGVVLNSPVTNRNLRSVAMAVDIPVIMTVTSDRTNIRDRLRYGASIFNVAAGRNTPEIVRMIDERYPDVPIIASGGTTPESILATIEAGANAITYTPPSSKELFSDMMKRYRENY